MSDLNPSAPATGTDSTSSSLSRPGSATSLLPVAIVGAGAAGYFAAITCAEQNPHRSVILLEKASRALAKVRISGGGRCNVTHACFDPKLLIKHYPRGARELLGPFTRFQPRDVVAFFERRGVPLKTEEDGRMFPVSDRSESIVDCLQEAAERAGVVLKTQWGVQKLKKLPSGAFRLTSTHGETLEAQRVLLATGGTSGGFALAQQLGHTIVPAVPSLFTFEVADASLHALAGNAVSHARVELVEAGLVQEGPLLITHWGLSGPAVLKLSAWGARFLHTHGYRARLRVSWLADHHEEQLRARFQAERSQHARRQVSTQSIFGMPQRLWEWLLTRAAVPLDRRWAELTRQEINSLVQQLLAQPLEVSGKGVFKEEFVTAGGVALKEVSMKTAESRVCPGLFLAGEVLDIDGVTGGFNFQSAWTMGWLAGKGLAE